MRLAPINQADPVNWSHPLNQGKVAWWLALPHLSGGPSLPDFAARRDVPVVGAWSTQSQHIQMPLSVYTGTSSLTYLTSPSLSLSAPPLTIVHWAKIETRAGNYNAALGGTDGRAAIITGGTYMRYMWELSADEYDGASGITNTYGGWQLLALVITASYATIYRVIDGALRSWTNTKTHNTYTLGAMNIGTERNLSANLQPQTANDTAIYGRALSADEIMACHAESVAGYPTMLNRLGSSFLLAPPLSGGPFPWFLDQSAMSGGLQTMGL